MLTLLERTTSDKRCMFDMFVWFLGGVFRLLVIGVPIAALMIPAVYLAYLVTRP